ncbi:MAG: chorismate mutase [Aestuariivirgaceae bacterium]|nr:chorismate mutase [Aestuariivirgaceae bacterium]
MSKLHPLSELRAEIDALDAELVKLLAKRARVVERVAAVKAAEALPALIPERVEEVVARVKALAVKEGVDPALAESVWRAMIAWFVDYEEHTLSSLRT